jgi:hypothetical protein
MRMLKNIGGSIAFAASLAACASVEPKDYSAFRAEDPHSILVVPVLNNSISVDAPEFFLSTVSRPFAERGYYVFPANMVKSVLERSGLSDAALVHNANPRRLEELFGCSAVLFITIQKWESQYVVISTSTNVEFVYVLKSCRTGATVWLDKQSLTYSPQASGNSGNPLADLIAQAVVSAIEKAAPNYMPLTRQANLAAATVAGQGLPAGPYLTTEYGKDIEQFPNQNREQRTGE